jgi:rare lipoprotein A
MTIHYPLLVSISLVITLSGCSYSGRPFIHDGAPSQPISIASIPNATPRVEPITRAGNPPTYRVLGKNYRLMQGNKGYSERGIASWYGTKFHGRKTSNGERYDMYAMTAAHKTLLIPAYLKVTNLKNNRSVIVRVNDRGPFHANRIIDLSYTAAAKLDILKTGTGFVEIETIDPSASAHPKKPITPIKLAATEDEIYLQVGAFGEHANALKLSQQIHSGSGAKVRIQADNEKQNAIYRVQVGPLNSAADVDQITQKLLQFGITRPHLVVTPKR